MDGLWRLGVWALTSSERRESDGVGELLEGDALAVEVGDDSPIVTRGSSRRVGCVEVGP